MRTQFSRRRNSGRSFVIGGAIVLLVLVFFGVRMLLPGVFFAIASPVLTSGSSLTGAVGNVFAGFESNAKLARENAALAREVDTLKNQNLALTARTQDLTKLLGGDTDALHGILAGVLAHPPVSSYDTLIVAAGSQNGVAANAEVFAEGGVPLGTVKSVTTNTALVSLFSTSGRSTEGWVGENRVPITLQGKGGGAFSAVISKDAPIAVGDNVYVPGPGAVPIGTVSKVEADPSSPTVNVRIMPAVNLFSVTWVEIAPK